MADSVRPDGLAAVVPGIISAVADLHRKPPALVRAVPPLPPRQRSVAVQSKLSIMTCAMSLTELVAISTAKRMSMPPITFST